MEQEETTAAVEEVTEETEESPYLEEQPDENMGLDLDETTETPSADESTRGEEAGGAGDEVSPINPGLISLAQTQYGLSDQEARSFGSDDALLSGLNLLNTRQASPEQPESQDEGTESSQSSGTFQFGEEFLETIDESIVDTLKSMSDHYQGQINALTEQSHAREGIEFAGWIDGQFNAEDSPPEFEGIYGKGLISDHQPDSKEYLERQSLVQQMESIQAVRAQQSLPPLDWGQALKQAHVGLHVDQVESHARKAVNGKVQGRRNIATNRPTNRNSQSNLNSDQQALQNLQRRMKSKGIDEDSLEASEMAEFDEMYES